VDDANSLIPVDFWTPLHFASSSNGIGSANPQHIVGIITS